MTAAREAPLTTIPPLEHLDSARFDAPAILKKLASSSRRLAELKGTAESIPNQGIRRHASISCSGICRCRG